MLNKKISVTFKAKDEVSRKLHKICVGFSARAIINQLKDQIKFNYCRRYMKLGIKILAIRVSDDFTVETEIKLPELQTSVGGYFGPVTKHNLSKSEEKEIDDLFGEV